MKKYTLALIAVWSCLGFAVAGFLSVNILFSAGVPLPGLLTGLIVEDFAGQSVSTPSTELVMEDIEHVEVEASVREIPERPEKPDASSSYDEYWEEYWDNWDWESYWDNWDWDEEDWDSLSSLSYDESKLTVYLDQTFPADGVDHITINTISEATRLYESNTNEIRVVHKGYNLPDNRRFEASVSGSSFTLARKPHNDKNSGNNYNTRSLLDIYLPKGYGEALEYQMTSGSLDIQMDLDLKDLSLGMTSGSIRSEEDIRTANADLSMTSGSFYLDELKADNYMITVTSGSFYVDSLTGSGSAAATSGSVNLGEVVVTDHLDLKLTSGVMRVELEEGQEFQFSGSYTSGNINTFFPTTAPSKKTLSATVGTSPSKTITASTTAGTITISED